MDPPKSYDRWEFCTEVISEIMPYSSSVMYVQKYLKLSNHDALLELINNLRNTFKEILSQSNWMDKKTKYFALEKV